MKKTCLGQCAAMSPEALDRDLSPGAHCVYEVIDGHSLVIP
jgi:hypothetical protein